MKKVGVVALILFSIIVLFSCSETPLQTPAQQEVVKYVPIERPEPLSVERITMDIAWIDASMGGTVGGAQTGNNSYTIPAGAIDQSRYFLLLDLSDFWGVLCLPSGSFNTPVTMTLSYAGLDTDEYPLDELVVLWSNGNGEWEPVEGEITWDTVNKTGTFQVNHFTRYSWGTPSGS